MNKSGSKKGSSKNKTTSERHSKFMPLLILGAVAVAIVGIGAIALYGSSRTVTAAPESQPTSNQDKKYIATRDIVVDKETGRLRKPNSDELKELVDSLKTLTKRPEENLPASSLSGGAEAIDLDGGFGGTILARPRTDGTFETKCVFTFEEGTEFLGLVEDNS